MNDASTSAEEIPDDESPIKLFGDPRSSQVPRAPERRSLVEHETNGESHPEHAEHHDTHLEVVRTNGEWHVVPAPPRPTGPGRALRLGRGDGFAAALNALGVVVFIVSMVAGALILYNAQDVGAFSDPLNSNRVAIGIAVLAMGAVQAAILIGVARVLTYLLASLRLKMKEVDHLTSLKHVTDEVRHQG